MPEQKKPLWVIQERIDGEWKRISIPIQYRGKVYRTYRNLRDVEGRDVRIRKVTSNGGNNVQNTLRL